MKRVWNVFRYLTRDSLAAVAVYYIVIAMLLILGFSLSIAYNGTRIGFNGFKLATAIFLFVAGINSFKAPYLFMQANGIIRGSFFRGGVMALAVLAVGMTLIDEALYGILTVISPPEGSMAEILYPRAGFFGTLLWTVAGNLLAVFAGWCVTMLYYRANKAQKLAISLSPAVLFTALMFLDPAIGCWKAIASAFTCLMGLSGSRNIYIGVLFMFAASVLMAAFSFLLVRRAQVKEQDR